ncbi:MAG: hypothetical protein JXB46_02440, partial [Candidatus Eisenbacteria bacterium]|nr:hypothetical protein [Candidatus Eisenbacteria bacterium]
FSHLLSCADACPSGLVATARHGCRNGESRLPQRRITAAAGPPVEAPVRVPRALLEQEPLLEYIGAGSG